MESQKNDDIAQNIFDFITNFLKFFSYVATGAIVILMVLLFVESIVRKVSGHSLVTVNEVGGIGMYLFVILSVGWLYIKGQHINADFFINRVNAKLLHIIKLLHHILSAFFAILASYLWWNMMATTLESGRHYRFSEITEWPFHILGFLGWVVLFCAAIACFIIQLKSGLDKTKIIER